MRAANRRPPHPAWLAGALALTCVACTGSDTDSRAHQIDGQRAQLVLPGADAFGGDALTSDALGADSGGLAGEDAWADGAASAEDALITDIPVADTAQPGDTWVSGTDSVPGGADSLVPEDTESAPGSDVWPADGDTPLADTAPEDTAADDDTSGGGQILPPPGMKVEWCRLIHPAVVQYAQGGVTDVFAHVSVPGQTDITEVLPDPAPWLRGQVGWGPIGALPHHDPSLFAWIEASPDPTPPDDLFWRYDRYVVPLAIDAPGSWDYVARFSADGGASWVYCDLDGSQNGYLPGEAGRATVAE